MWDPKQKRFTNHDSARLDGDESLLLKLDSPSPSDSGRSDRAQQHGAIYLWWINAGSKSREKKSTSTHAPDRGELRQEEGVLPERHERELVEDAVPRATSIPAPHPTPVRPATSPACVWLPTYMDDGGPLRSSTID